MTADRKDYQLAYRRLMLVVAAAMLGWAIPYGIANYKFDGCTQSLVAHNKSNNLTVRQAA
jgi:hypothetical protein